MHKSQKIIKNGTQKGGKNGQINNINKVQKNNDFGRTFGRASGHGGLQFGSLCPGILVARNIYIYILEIKARQRRAHKRFMR